MSAKLLLPERMTISANDYAADALALMRRLDQDYLYVLDQNQVAGLIYARDLERHPEAVLRDRDVREYLTTRLR